LPSAVSGTRRYARSGLVNLRVVMLTSFTGIVTAVAGSLASHRVPGHGHVLMIATAVVVGFTAWRMARASSPDEEIDEAEPETLEALTGLDAEGGDGPPPVPAGGSWRFAVTGVAAGPLGGLLGPGGGPRLVPRFPQ